MSIAFLFPGQGSHYPGMLRRLPDHAAVHAVIEQAGKLLGIEIAGLDSEQELQSTVAVQTTLFIAGVAVARALQAEGIRPSFVAGLSVGSFAAAVISEALDFADGLALVRARASAMQAAFPDGYGMTAVVGLSVRQTTRLIAAWPGTESGAALFLSNINAPAQMVVSGSNDALIKFEAAARAAGARKVERLSVSVPSHCPLLASTALMLEQKLTLITLREPQVTYVGNVKARALREAKKIADDLAQNVANCVHWYDSIGLMSELGATVFLEMNPGNLLTRINSEILPDTRSLAVEDCSIQYLREKLL